MAESFEEFNTRINRTIEYTPDDHRDVWQSPQDTLKRKKGDCEDIAILKFFILLDNGIAEENLRLCYCTVNEDAHMVLLLWDDEWLVLDNLLDNVYPLRRYTAIKEKFRFNRKNLWIGDKLTRHNPQKAMKKWKEVNQQFYMQSY